MFDAISLIQSSLRDDQVAMDIISQNVSNLQTPAYKRQGLMLKNYRIDSNNQFDRLLKPTLSYVELEQGSLTNTGISTHVALVNEGFFVVQQEQGNLFTRRGDFHINKDGQLVTFDNHPVAGEHGSIVVGDQSFKLGSHGEVYLDNKLSDQIKLVRFNNKEQLSYIGNGSFSSKQSPVDTKSTINVLQGYLEQTNVKNSNEMLEMIKISQHFSSVQRLLKTEDSIISLAIRQLGESNV